MNIEPTGKVMPPCGQGIPARVEITDEMVERAAEVIWCFWDDNANAGWNTAKFNAMVRETLDTALNGEKP